MKNTRIERLNVNKILVPGVEFTLDRTTQGWRVKLLDEIVWDFPASFMDHQEGRLSIFHSMWYNNHIRDLYHFLNKYLSTPKSQIIDFTDNYCFLRDILITADRRIGRHHLYELMFTTDSAAARKIIAHRLNR